MYLDQTATEPAYFPDNAIGNSIAGSPLKLSPLACALNLQGEQIDKLGGLIGELEQRLSVVRNSSPDADGEGRNERTPSSPLVNQVYNQIGMVQNLQTRLQSLLSELEV